eukprot:3539644-Rhodomonas_salina.2
MQQTLLPPKLLQRDKDTKIHRVRNASPVDRVNLRLCLPRSLHTRLRPVILPPIPPPVPVPVSATAIPAPVPAPVALPAAIPPTVPVAVAVIPPSTAVTRGRRPVLRWGGRKAYGRCIWDGQARKLLRRNRLLGGCGSCCCCCFLLRFQTQNERMQGGGERVGKFGAVGLKSALECWEPIILLGETNDEFGQGLVADAHMVLKLRAHLAKQNVRCGSETEGESP